MDPRNSPPEQMTDEQIAALLQQNPTATQSPRATKLTPEQQNRLPEGADPLTVTTASASDTTGGECPARCFAPRRSPAIPLYPQPPPLQLPQH